MKISSILTGALLVVASEAWGIKFYGEGKSFSVHGTSKTSCENLDSEFTGITVDKFHWEPSNIANAFIAYDTSDCSKEKGGHAFKWLGETERNVDVDEPQKIKSYQVGGGSDAD